MGSDQPSTTTVTDSAPGARVPDQTDRATVDRFVRARLLPAPVGSDALNDALSAFFRLVEARGR